MVAVTQNRAFLSMSYRNIGLGTDSFLSPVPDLFGIICPLYVMLRGVGTLLHYDASRWFCMSARGGIIDSMLKHDFVSQTFFRNDRCVVLACQSTCMGGFSCTTICTLFNVEILLFNLSSTAHSEVVVDIQITISLASITR